MKTMYVIIFVASLILSGCASQGINGAMGGAAIGAGIGQAIGHNTEATLIGAAVGTMFGYIGGNEVDKYRQQQQMYVPPQPRYAPPPQHRNPQYYNPQGY